MGHYDDVHLKILSSQNYSTILQIYICIWKIMHIFFLFSPDMPNFFNMYIPRTCLEGGLWMYKYIPLSLSFCITHTIWFIRKIRNNSKFFLKNKKRFWRMFLKNFVYKPSNPQKSKILPILRSNLQNLGH